MYYGGFEQGFGGEYAGGDMQANAYQQQMMMMQYQANGGVNPYDPAGMMAGGFGGDGATGDRSAVSYTGPPSGMERKSSSVSRNRTTAAQSKKDASGLARHGSFFAGASERDTQKALSTRGGTSVRGIGPAEEEEELKEYYGDMATRNKNREMDGTRAVRSYRGDIEDGQDVGKPRRVTSRRNVEGHSSTGYGGITFKRKAAMRNGEKWGDVEVRMRAGAGDAYGQFGMGGAMLMAPVEEGPAMPQVFNQEDVCSYSNVSDAFEDSDGESEADY